MFDVIAACILAASSVGVWVCAISLLGDKFGLGLTRWKAAMLAPLFLLLALATAAHFFREDLNGLEVLNGGAR